MMGTTMKSAAKKERVQDTAAAMTRISTSITYLMYFRLPANKKQYSHPVKAKKMTTPQRIWVFRKSFLKTPNPLRKAPIAATMEVFNKAKPIARLVMTSFLKEGSLMSELSQMKNCLRVMTMRIRARVASF